MYMSDQISEVMHRISSSHLTRHTEFHLEYCADCYHSVLLSAKKQSRNTSTCTPKSEDPPNR